MSNIKVWAHRGASGYAPENSIESFKMAADMKADGVELDVQLTKDGQVVVIHDETINRVSDGKGYVKDFTYEELKKFNFNKGMKDFTCMGVPLLEDVYKVLKDTDLIVNVEFKTGVFFYDGIIEKVFKITKDMGMEDRVIYSSFNHYTVLKVKEMNKKASVGFLYQDGIIGMVKYARKHDVKALHPALYNLQYEGFVEDCKKHKIDLNVWTVNKKEHIRLVASMGVNAIITNYPDRAIKILKEMNLR